MRKKGLLRGALLAGLASGCALGQRLPAAAPTSAPAAVQANAAVQTSAVAAVPVPSTAAPVNAAMQPATRAHVTWAGGLLTIQADNSSLNGILREVSQQTGMKVTGGVAEDRVYGTYGPGAAETVLGTLLTGTGSNVLLKENTPTRPMELVLTPRQGGATPPGPSTYAGEREQRIDDLPPQRIRPGMRQTERAEETPENGGTGDGGATVRPGVQAPAAATTDQQSPNGVKTPQQIYDQLMKLQQQKAAAPPPQ